MCCWTHKERDEADKRNGVVFTLAESKEVRCQCKFGVTCQRRMTEEDLLCDWCRGRNHSEACNELSTEPHSYAFDGFVFDRVVSKTFGPYT
jgi:hypothetical protein